MERLEIAGVVKASNSDQVNILKKPQTYSIALLTIAGLGAIALGVATFAPGMHSALNRAPLGYALFSTGVALTGIACVVTFVLCKRKKTESDPDKQRLNPIFCYGGVDIALTKPYIQTKPTHITEVTVEAKKTLEAVVGLDGKTAILSFANAAKPGGEWKDEGVNLQEESLVRASLEYEHDGIKEHELSYALSRAKSISPIRDDGKFIPEYGCIYLDKINYRIGENIQPLATFAVAAQNLYAPELRGNPGARMVEFKGKLSECIRAVLFAALNHECDNIVLGAIGCGAYGWNANDVAEIYKKVLVDFEGKFKKIIFAVPAGANHDAFKAVFGAV